MGRKAGDTTHYRWALIDKSTGIASEDHDIELISVTSVLSAVLAKPVLYNWYYRKGIEGIAISLQGIDPNEETDGFRNYDLLCDEDVLDDLLRSNLLRPQDIADEAAAIGTERHEFLEHLANVYLDVDAAEAKREAELYLAQMEDLHHDDAHWDGHAIAIARWWLKRKPEVLASEELVYSLRHGFAGTLDLSFMSNGMYCMTDLKNRAANRDAYASDHIQVGAYDLAKEEMTGRKADQRSVLVARADGTFVERHTPMAYRRETFLFALEVYKGMEALKGAR